MANRKDFNIRTAYYGGKKVKMAYDYTGLGGHVDVPEGVGGLFSTFFQRRDVTSVTLPASLRVTQSFAFGSSGIRELVFPEGMESIGDTSCSGCVDLERAVIPDSVTRIDPKAFCGCPKLIFEFTGEHPHFRVENNGLIDENGRFVCLANDQISGVYSIPKGVTVIGDNAFSSAYLEHQIHLTGVELPDTVTEVDSYAFTGWQGLERIIFPASVKKLGLSIVEGCRKLKEIVILGREVEVSGAFTGYGADGKLDPNTVILAPHMPLSWFDKEVRRNAAIGTAHAQAQSMALDEDVKAEAVRYLKGQRKRLLADSIQDGALLRFLFKEKLVPVQEVQTYLDEADRLGMPEVKASILEYQHRWLGAFDPLEDCEKEFAKAERAAKKAEKQAKKTPEELAAEEAEEARKAAEKETKIWEEFEKSGTLPAGIAKKDWSYEKQKDGTLILTSWKGACCELDPMNYNKAVGKVRDVKVPAVIGKTPVTCLDKRVFETMSYSHVNNYQRQQLRTVIVPEGVVELGNYLFDGCGKMRRLVLPASVIKIGPLYWIGKMPKGLTIAAPAGSYAERYARENDIKFEIL